MNIPIGLIELNLNRRKIDPSKVVELAESIHNIGLINPISVREAAGDKYQLVTGLHRLEAYRELGLNEIPVTIVNTCDGKIELMEIDENLIRNEIHFIDRGDYFNRRDDILIDLGLRSKVGDNQYSTLGSPESGVPKTTNAMAKEVGISVSKLYEEKQLAKNLIPEAKEVLRLKDVTKEEVKRISREDPETQLKIIQKLNSKEAKNHKEAILKIKRDEIMEKIEDGPKASNECIDIYNTNNKYRVIYADPPWAYGNSMPEYFTEQKDHYTLMTMDEICQLPIDNISEDNGVLFLWVTSPILEECFRVINSWGFRYKSSFVWDKIKHNMGHYNSVRHEFLLIATKGSCQPDIQKLYDSVQSIERRAHSEKPEDFRAIIDHIYPLGARIELFARKSVKGWDAYGNEL